MRITVRVKPNSKVEKIEKVSDTEFIVRVQAPPLEGRANKAVIEALHNYFRIPRSRIRIAHGEAGKVKYIDIN